MKKISFILLLFLQTTLTFAFQSENLQTVLASSISDVEKINKINAISFDLIENNNLADAETAAQKALEMSKTASSEVGRAGALDNFGLIAQMRFDYTNAMTFFVQSLKIKDGLGDKGSIASSKNHIGKVFFLQRNQENASTNYESALALLKEAPAALPVLAETNRNLGDLYLSQKVYGKAKDAFDNALKIYAEDLQDFKKAAGVASYLGKVVADLGDNDGALTYFNASLNFHRNLNDPKGMANDYLSLSKIYTALADNELAAENVGNALSIFEQLQDNFGMADAFHLNGKIALKNNNRSKAEEYFEKSGELLRGLKAQPGISEIYKTIADGFGEMGNFPKAYTYSQAYASSRDDLFNKEKAASLLELTTKYESEYAVKDKNRQLATMEGERSKEAMIRWLLIGLVGMALLGIYYVIKSNRQKQKDNEKLVAMNGTIQEQNSEIARQNILTNLANSELNEKNGRLDNLNAQLVHEISERENSQRVLFSKDHYLANVTAQMRNPLNDIVGSAQSLMNEKPRTDQREHLQNLQFSTNNLLVLINDVLDFSEIEASKISLETVDFRPEDVVKDLIKENKSNKEIQFEHNIDSRIPEVLKGDPVRLQQILTYLTKNLKKEMKNGVIKVNIVKNELIDNEMTLKIDVTTNGKDIRFDNLDAIFNQPANRKDFENMNDNDLEFVVARRLVELQNGTIHASRVKDETLITVFLPFKIVSELTTNAANTEGVVPTYNDNFLEGKRVLVVEDNKVNQMLVMNMLKKKGVLVTAANDGIEGLEALEKADFDVILMDIQMPRMDGYRAVAEIRRLKNTEKSTLPIIALTASAYVTEKEKAQLFGMTDHIGKPFSPDELLDKLSRVLMSHIANTDEAVMPTAAVSTK